MVVVQQEVVKQTPINIIVPVEFDQCLEYVSACTGKTKRILLMEGFLELVKKHLSGGDYKNSAGVL